MTINYNRDLNPSVQGKREGKTKHIDNEVNTMSTSETEIEEMIRERGLTQPRLTPEGIDKKIESETYTIMPSGKTIVCELTLRNGFTVRGEASVVSRSNFNEEVGRKISREDARNKVWQLEGYLLQQKLHEEATNKEI